MTRYDYDIEEVKKYFFYFIYRKQTRSMNEEQYERYTKKPYFLLSEKVGGILLWIISTIFLVLFTFFSLKDGLGNLSGEGIGGFFIPFCIISSGLLAMFVLGMKMFFRARNLDSLEKYFEKKQDCISTLSWFDKVIELDRSESGLNPEHIEEIRNTIRDIEYLSKMLLGPLARFGNLSKELGLSEREVMRKFMSNEFDWTVEYIENFRTLLSRWMEVHEKEIRDETNTLKQKNIREFGGAIERLNIQSEALEKVKVSL